MKRLSVVLAGEESAGLRTLRLIEGSGHRLALVLATPPEESESAPAAGATSLWRAAERAGHRTLPAATVALPAAAGDLARWLGAEGVDLLLNVHSLHVVRPEILRAPRIGSFNLHPGPLPRYAGLDTVSWALYRGETDYGVTVHEMKERIDAGGVAFQASFRIEPEDTAFTLYARCIREGLGLLERLLDAAATEGRVPVAPQDLAAREYFPRRGAPQEGRVDWTRPASQVHDFVRACDYGPFPSPWGRPKTTLDSPEGAREIEILETALAGQPSEAPPGTVRTGPEGARQVACADQWLELRALRVDGQRSAPDEVLDEGARLA